MYSHRELCFKAAKYLKNKGIFPYHRCRYVVCELERVGECPDAFGWGNGATQLIEVKVSRSDFLADKLKFWRYTPQKGLGEYRSYLCLQNIISESELPNHWGLLYVNPNGKIEIIKRPELQESNHREEINLITSILRRNNIRPQIFSYKKYKTDLKE